MAFGRRRGRAAEPHSKGRSVKVSAWLATLTILPLLGVASLVYGELSRIVDSRQDLASIDRSIEELVDLSELRAAVLAEGHWATIVALTAPPVTDASATVGQLGVDAAQRLHRARGAVDLSLDRSLDDTDLTAIEAALVQQRARLLTNPQIVSQAYEAIAGEVEQEFTAAIDELATVADAIDGGTAIIRSARALDAASAARAEATLRLTDYVRVEAADADSVTAPLVSLGDHDSAYREALDAVARLALPGGRTGDELTALEREAEVVAFDAAVAEATAGQQRATRAPSSYDRFADGHAVPGADAQTPIAQTPIAQTPIAQTPAADSAAPDAPAQTGEVEVLSLGLTSGQRIFGPHMAIVRTAAADLDDARRLVNAAITRSSLLAVVKIAFLIITSILLSIGLARGIGNPLRRLAGGAHTLRDGAEGAPLRPSGPTEIREAMLAINEAAAHIHLAERQAQALAKGDLQNAALSESAPGALGRSLQEAVQTLAGSLNEREEFRRRLAHEATHDSLTQVANRGASLARLNQGLARASRSGSTLAVLFIDLDGFKEVNDHHGHPVGDAVLWSLAKRLTKSVRAGDHVGRLGGDEFLVIAEPVTGPEEALLLAKRLADDMSQPLLVGTTTVTISASIGVAMGGPGSGLTATEILHDADLAVYRAKELGRSRIEICDAELHAELARRAAIGEALREAIPNGELTMYYQPILDANTAKLVSLEALLRWERPGHGFVPPDVFIPIAERSDLILEVDNWVVHHVVKQLQEWSGNKMLRKVPIGINISGRHLALENFVSHILDPIRNAAIDPSRVVLEVTEGALLDDLDAAAAKLQILRNQGIRIAIDDFGTGYTSLGHLRSLPVDILKIDRTFIQDESAGSLVKLIIDTGHLLGATITSEGIETADQAEHLTKLGSDALQGYLFARPMPAAEVEQQLAASSEAEPAFLH